VATTSHRGTGVRGTGVRGQAEEGREPVGHGIPSPGAAQPRPARTAHRGGPVRLGQQPGEHPRERAWVPAVDHLSGHPFAYGLRRATRAAGDHRQPGGRCLQQRDAQPLDVQPAAPGAAGQREDVTDGVVREVRIALGGVAPRPWRATKAEAVLRGAPATEEVFGRAAEAELAEAQPLPGNAFKVPLARNTLVRTLLDLTAEEVQP